MTADQVHDLYFEWMSDIVCSNRYPKDISYRKLLMLLHNTEFKWFIKNDVNRARDGIDLRYRFSIAQNDRTITSYLNGPCSVLEMMVALAIKCEEGTMSNTEFGDRTSQWFWTMACNLGLGAMTDDHFDKNAAKDIIKTFLYREYSSDGRGGLFTVRNRDRDLREVEIWYQLCWYLDNLV